MRRFTKFYGANPLHLIAMVFCIALVLAAIMTAGPETFVNKSTWWKSIGVWFVGAAIAHDVVLFPLYALADRSLTSGLDAMRGRRKPKTPSVPALNYIRLPFLGTGLTFLMFFPGIIQQGSESYTAATGLTQDPYLVRWLWLVVAMFAASAIAYSVRLALHARSDSAVSKGSVDLAAAG